MDFVATYAKAETIQDKIKCHIAKCLGAKVVTPMGRILLLPKDYDQKAIETGNADLILTDLNLALVNMRLET